MPPIVSVLINNYNYARFLPYAVESVLNQDFPSTAMEIIAVDDASTDDSLKVLESFGPRVSIVRMRQNMGQGAAFNRGFYAATGKFLCLLDSDDWWAPTKVTRVVARFEREPDLGMVQHWCEEVGPGGRPLPARYPGLPSRFTAADFLNGKCLFTGTSGLSFRADAVMPLLPVPEDLRICADGFLYLNTLNFPVGNMPEILAWRRIHSDNRYAARYRDVKKLRIHRAALDALDREQGRFLAGRPLAPSVALEQFREKAFEDMLIARAEGRFSDALARLRELRASYAGKERLFKTFSLLTALFSARLYSALRSLYGRARNG